MPPQPPSVPWPGLRSICCLLLTDHLLELPKCPCYHDDRGLDWRWQQKHSRLRFHFYLCSGMGLGGVRPPPSVLPPPPCGVGAHESELRGSLFLFTWHLAGDSRVDRSPDFRPVSEGAFLPAGRAPTARTLPLGQGTSATRAVQGAGLMEQMGGLRQSLEGPFHRPCRGATSLQRRSPGGTAVVLLRELVLSGGTEMLLKGVRVSQPPQESRPSSGC